MPANKSNRHDGKEHVTPLAGAFFALLDLLVAQSLERLKSQELVGAGEPLLLTRAEACKMLSVGTSTINRLREDGRLKTVKIGTKHKYPLDEIQRFIREEKT